MRRRGGYVLVLVGVVGVLQYGRSWSYGFVYDDVVAVARNPVVMGQGGWWGALVQPYWPARMSPDAIHRPVTMLTLRLNAAIFGRSAGSFHVVNCLLHGLASVLLAVCAMRLWGCVSAGLAAGLLFAVHPVTAEAVTPVVGRSEILAVVFVLGMACVQLGRVRRLELGVGSVSVAGHHVLMAVLFLLGCFSKEHAVFGLAVVVAIDAWSWRRGSGLMAPARSIRDRLNALGRSHYLGLLLSAVVFFLCRWLLFGWRTGLPASVDNSEANPFEVAGLMERVATPFRLLALSAELMVVPVRLCPIWSKGGLSMAESFLAPDVLVGVVLAVLMVVVAVVGLRRGWAVAVGVCGLGAFLLIPCHFITAASWFFAERWLYAPLAMAALAVAGLVRFRERVAVVVVVVLASVLSVETWRYQACWRNDEAVITAVVARQPNSYIGLREWCRMHDARGRIEAAADAIDRLVRVHPDEPLGWYFLARLHAARGEWSAARSAMAAFEARATLPEYTVSVIEFVDAVRRHGAD